MKKNILIYSFILITYSLAQAQTYTISTFAGDSVIGYKGDGGDATAAELGGPTGVVIDHSGNVYIADLYNEVIRIVNTNGIISTFAGNGINGYSGDGGAATASELYYPYAIAIDKLGNLYIADKVNERIRKVNTVGVISTLAGNGAAGYKGDGGAATSAEFNSPDGVAIDDSENVYISDYYNNCIRKVDTKGIISTFAGNGTAGYNSDGIAATAAELYQPGGVAVDNMGNVYIADSYNARIRKVNTKGIISTVAGDGNYGYSGDGGAATSAEFKFPMGVSLDSSGNIYIADESNNVIRKVNSIGIITTIAGNGILGYWGNGVLATTAELSEPVGLEVDDSDNVYIADFTNQRVRKLTPGPTGLNELYEINFITLYPNPNKGIFKIQLQNILDKTQVELFNIIGEQIKNEELRSNSNTIDLSNSPSGIYLYRILTERGNLVSEGKFTIQK